MSESGWQATVEALRAGFEEHFGGRETLDYDQATSWLIDFGADRCFEVLRGIGKPGEVKKPSAYYAKCLTATDKEGVSGEGNGEVGIVAGDRATELWLDEEKVAWGLLTQGEFDERQRARASGQPFERVERGRFVSKRKRGIGNLLRKEGEEWENYWEGKMEEAKRVAGNPKAAVAKVIGEMNRSSWSESEGEGNKAVVVALSTVFGENTMTGFVEEDWDL